jgi:hypothetical protein
MQRKTVAKGGRIGDFASRLDRFVEVCPVSLFYKKINSFLSLGGLLGPQKCFEAKSRLILSS